MARKFQLEKILEVDLETYLGSVGKKISDYNLKGVIVEGVIPGSITEMFQQEVPRKTEVVVGYHVELHLTSSRGGELKDGRYTTLVESHGANAYGTALIPKKNSN